jgi:hypothetical protein
MTTSPTTPTTATTGHTLPLRPRALVASVLVSAATIGPVAMAASTATFGASQSTSTARTGMVLLGGGIVLTMVGYLAAVIAVIAWLRRARANAEVLSTAPHRLAAGWAVGAWFVPVAAMVLPYWLVSDVVRASTPDGRRPVALVTWWASWIGAHLVLVLVSYIPTGGVRPGLLAVELIAQAALHVVAAFSFTRLALGLAARQDARIAA